MSVLIFGCIDHVGFEHSRLADFVARDRAQANPTDPGSCSKATRAYVLRAVINAVGRHQQMRQRRRACR